jgi:hypothetical protein
METVVSLKRQISTLKEELFLANNMNETTAALIAERALNRYYLPMIINIAIPYNQVE